MLRILLLSFCALLVLPGADLASVTAEPNLERRSALALDKAEAALGAARSAYDNGQIEEFRQQVTSAAELTDLCYQSLQDSGKRARRSPKWFKRAEQKMLVMLRRIDNFVKDVGGDERPAVEALQKRVRDVHEQLLQDIMSSK